MGSTTSTATFLTSQQWFPLIDILHLAKFVSFLEINHFFVVVLLKTSIYSFELFYRNFLLKLDPLRSLSCYLIWLLTDSSVLIKVESEDYHKYLNRVSKTIYVLEYYSTAFN